MFAPAGTPPEVAERLASELKDFLSRPGVQEKFRAVGIEAFWTGPKDFDAFVRSELRKWSGLIQAAGIEPQ
jgi:tripartite-type tricarboxylate transporter receptor subunit TctC